MTVSCVPACSVRARAHAYISRCGQALLLNSDLQCFVLELGAKFESVKMPTSKLCEYVVLETIGGGSFGTCRKVSRKLDGKVGTNIIPVASAYS